MFLVLFDISHNIFSYLVSRKMKVYNDVWLLNKKSCAFRKWALNPVKISDQNRHIQDGKICKILVYILHILKSAKSLQPLMIES